MATNVVNVKQLNIRNILSNENNITEIEDMFYFTAMVVESIVIYTSRYIHRMLFAIVKMRLILQ